MPWAGIFFQNDPNYGIFVSNVVANSAAHQCGIILRGDFLTRVDNVEITSKTTLDQVNSTPLSSCNREGAGGQVSRSGRLKSQRMAHAAR